jgi:preprotein translocase subunit YajC
VSSNAITLIVLVVVFAGMLAFTSRARRRQAQRVEAQAAQLTVGSEVMTTSGLYGTVVARNDDDTVQLSIAPGVEVRWAVAALRDVASLPQRYQTAPPHDGQDGPTPGADPAS